MSSSVVERTRALHADTEEMKERLLTMINKHATNAKDRILLDHELKHQLDELCACQAKLLELYEDADGVRASELRAMTGGGSTEQLWTNFYDTLSQIRMYHAKFPNAARIGTLSSAVAAASTAAAGVGKDGAASSSAEGEIAAQDSDSILLSGGRSVHFSAEESFGARVDMHELYERYINLPQFARTGAAGSGAAPIDYLSFLRDFPAIGRSVSREKKLKAHPQEYRRFLTDLRDYLIGFHERTKPLAESSVLREMIRQEFETQWENKTVEGWFGENNGAAPAAAAAALEQEPGAPAAAAATAPSAAAPVAAAAAEFYCSACSKQFAGQGVFTAHLSGKKHKKNAEIAAALSASSSSSSAAAAAPAEDANTSAEGVPSVPAVPASLAKVTSDLRSLALLEMEIAAFADLLSSELSATRDHLLKKQTRTYEELQAEIAATQAEVLRAKMALKSGADGEPDEEEDPDSADANAPLYNPLNLPLGFDGKPIPYWLYKLHGLNLKFDCEICGDYSYAGPRNFERHFTEWRHAYGMRALGIPNTKHFLHITKMADALALFEKLKREGVGAGFKAEEEEEMEDAEGNVFNKRTFLELQKQGLV